MKRSRKMATGVGLENKKPEKTATTKSKQTNNKKDVKNASANLNRDQLNVVKIVLNAQSSDASSKKCLAELAKIYTTMNHDEFMSAFMQVVFSAMHREENDENANRIMKLAALFIASYGEDGDEENNLTHPIIINAFERILTVKSGVAIVRMCLCQIVTLIMNSFSAKAGIDDSIYESVIENMLVYLKDVSPTVRVHAIHALQRLQDPENNEDPVLKAYVYHMEFDPAVKVRQATLTAVGKRFGIIPHILDRLHDADEKVRRHVYLQMSSYSVKSYKISHRLQFLESGLYDRSESVHKTVLNIFLPSWISAYEYNYVEFVAAIKLDNKDEEIQRFRKIAQIALTEIFKKQKMKDVVASLTFSEEFHNCLPLDKISLEALIVWKVIVESHQNYVDGKREDGIEDDNEDNLEESINKDQSILTQELLPELSVFCEFMEKYLSEQNSYADEKWKKMIFNYCVLTLLEIVQLYDFGDEIGRGKLKLLLRKVLIEHTVSEDVVHQIVLIIEQLIDNVEERLDFFNNIVKEIVEPNASSAYMRKSVIDDIIEKSNDMNLQLEVTKLKLELMELKELESNYVEKKQYSEAQKIAEQEATLMEKLANVLKKASEDLNSTSPDSIQESISSLLISKKLSQSDLVKNLQISYYMIVSKGVKSLTHNVLSLYKDFIRRHLESHDTTVRVWALKTATAYSMLYEGLSKETYLTLKSQLFRNTNIPIWEVSIGCIFELLDRYGFDKMESTDEEDNPDKSLNQSKSKKGGRTLYTADIEQEEIMNTIEITQMMLHIMESSADMRIYKTILIGFCRIILHGHFCTREIVSKFLLAYFNPATEPEINQLLGVFFERLIQSKLQECLQEALVPTLLTLWAAPYDSPLQEVKIETILKYVIESTRPVYCSSGLNLHNTIAIKFLEIMLDNKQNKDTLKVFSKELLVLEISDDSSLKSDLIVLVDQLLDSSSVDVKQTKNILVFKEMLNGTYRAPLMFSSTATKFNTIEPVDELEEILEDDGRIKAEECLDVSLSDVKLREFTVNVGKKSGLDQIIEDEDEDEDEDATFVGNREDVNGDLVEIDSTQGPFNEIPATQEVNVSNVVETQEEPVYIPETQRFTAPDSSEEDENEVIPATPPASPKPRAGRQRLMKDQTKPVQKSNKRQISISASSSPLPVASPIRKSRRGSEQKKAVMTPLNRKKTDPSVATPPKVSRLSSRSVTATTPSADSRQSARSVPVQKSNKRQISISSSSSSSSSSPSVASPIRKSRRGSAQKTAVMTPLSRKKTDPSVVTTPTTALRQSARPVTVLTSPRVQLSRTLTTATPPKVSRLSSRLATATTPTPVTPRTKRATTERVNLPIPVKSKIPVKKAPIVKPPTKPIVVASKSPTRSSVAALRTTTRSKVVESKTTSNGTSTRRQQVLKSSIQPTTVVVEKEIKKVTRNKTTEDPAGIRNSPRTRRLISKK